MSSGRIWVITGVSTGLGFALAQYVISQGDKVIGTVRSLSKFPEHLRAIGVLPLAVDLAGTDEDVRKAGESALRLLGSVDVLVNNAGYGVIGPIEELSMADIRAQFQTNFFAVVAFSQPFITHFRERRTGHILNVSSIGGSVGFPSWGAYCASKAAVNLLTDTLSSELKLFGVRVLAIQPGYFSSALFGKLPNYRPPNDDPSPSDNSGTTLSHIYTDPDTQGYDTARLTGKIHYDSRQIGDPEKYAQRVYEVVSGTGLARDAVARPTAGGKWEGPWELNRVPIGPDSYAQFKRLHDLLGHTLRAYEAIASSTDVEEERLQYFPHA
ncbi:hypothetical protein NM688_g2121 [Phlebia brevispora]|uniref:Uncharacterized protein n=1 Tax=Phlebia brevispora TaxID=194682 RepID=A0ACC1T9P2_9APHY|nr:hypothetical protein NM688_g2121 [Phlebia brevispora]